jgi:cell division protein FtsI (penicillin-binding protein 3)
MTNVRDESPRQRSHRSKRGARRHGRVRPPEVSTRQTAPAPDRATKRPEKKKKNKKKPATNKSAKKKSARTRSTTTSSTKTSSTTRRSTRTSSAAGSSSSTRSRHALRRSRSRKKLERTPARDPARTGRGVTAPPPRRRATAAYASPRRRLIIALIAIAIVLLTIVGRVVFIQTKESGTLRSAGASQWARSYDIAAQRGTIFDRHGNELAMSVPAATISINPKLIENGPATIHLLDDLLDLPEEKVADLLFEVERKTRGFVYVTRQADAAIGDQLASLNLSGVNVERVDRREMPGGDTGRSVVGTASIDGEGIAGLELQYDDLLTGVDGSMRREIAPNNRTIPGSETIVENPVSGQDLVLSLDRSVQFQTEQVLLEQVTRIGARGATAIVMDTDSGEVFASASVRRDGEGGYEVTSGNFAAVDAYEPGSVAKVITIAGALDAGAVTPEDGFVVPWSKRYYADVLKDSHQHPDEWMTVRQILVESSNIGTIMVQQALGVAEHDKYMRAFGLGERTALDFPGESPGIVKEVEDRWGSEHVTVAYGQGVSSTSLQLVGAVNTIANGGTYVDPKLVLATVGPDGTVTERPPSETRRVVSETAASQTTAMMRDVVCRGTAKRAKVDGLSVAGKTGTAFKAADNGTYYDADGNRVYYASFVGFFPAEDPQVTVLVSVDEPPAGTGDRFGGTASAPVFAELAPVLIHELDIEPPEGSTGCEE